MDLNLLLVFRSIFDKGSLTAAAGELNLTQPAVSHALGRLRRELNDDLFVRQGRGIVPTERARVLYREISGPLASLGVSVAQSRIFAPASSTRIFKLCLSDIGEMDFLPRIVEGLRREAPRAGLEIVPMDASRIPEMLDRGQIDAAIASTDLGEVVQSDVIKRERYVALRAAHAEEALTKEAFATNALAMVRPSIGHPAPMAGLEKAGLVPSSIFTVQTFAVLPRLVSQGGMVAMAPETIAQGWRSRWPIRLDALPFPVEDLMVRLYWRSGATAADTRWIIDLILAAVGEPAAATKVHE